MYKNYHTVAFDLDGTLTDPHAGLTSAFRYAFSKMGIDYGDEAVLDSFIGPPIRELWQSMYGISHEESERMVDFFREYYSVFGWWDNKIYEGITELLSDLRAAGKKIILATSKPHIHSSKILRRFDIERYFDFAEGASFDTSREKKADVLRYAMLGVGLTDADKGGTVLVGDTIFDVEGAGIVGIDSIAVLYGYGKRDALLRAGATYIAESVESLREILL